MDCGKAYGYALNIHKAVTAWPSPTSQTPAKAQYLYVPGKALCNLHQDNTVGGWGRHLLPVLPVPKAPLVYLKLVLASSFKGSETTAMMQEPQSTDAMQHGFRFACGL